jgi:hypothetical protein
MRQREALRSCLLLNVDLCVLASLRLCVLLLHPFDLAKQLQRMNNGMRCRDALVANPGHGEYNHSRFVCVGDPGRTIIEPWL